MFDYVCVYLPGREQEIRKRLREKERCKTMQTYSTQNVFFTPSSETSPVFFGEQLGRLAPLKAMACVCVSIGKSVWDSTDRPFLPVFPPVNELSL